MGHRFVVACRRFSFKLLDWWRRALGLLLLAGQGQGRQIKAQGQGWWLAPAVQGYRCSSCSGCSSRSTAWRARSRRSGEPHGTHPAKKLLYAALRSRAHCVSLMTGVLEGPTNQPPSSLLRRRKWFRDPCAPSGRLGPGTQPIIVADGMMGTIPPGASAHGPHTTPHRPAGQQHAGAPARAHPRPVPGSVRQRDPATLWHFPPVQPTEDSLAEATAATTATHHPSWTGAAAKAARPGWAALDQGKGRGVGGVGGGVGSVQACDCTASEVLAERHGDPISDGVLESVLRGRRRFLRAQQLADGDLVAASDPRVNPVQVRMHTVISR